GKDDESSPCWSPDSRSICYVSRYATRPSLFVMPVEGGSPRRLSVGGVSNITEPDWSPDGKTIVFTAQMGSFNICTIPSEGGNATVITDGEDPAWASNSRTVIFTRRESGKRVLSLLDVPTKHVKDIHRISGSCSQACWAR
ncbi:MAG: tolB, partial [Verrucomicrobiales bacterium]|nr:tolB [Verrucomicrobiales bacterium]